MSALWLKAQWPAPANVHAGVSLRQANVGISKPPYDRFNLGAHVGDEPAHVEHNRIALQQQLSLSKKPCWLNQTHGIAVATLPSPQITPDADASTTTQSDTVCSILTADCLPVLLCNRQGTQVAAAHCGWRSLAGGVLENTLAQFANPHRELLAWLGPCISQPHYQVGLDVYDAFVDACPSDAWAFLPEENNRFRANLRLLAVLRLHRLGLTQVFSSEHCTVDDARFYSYRQNNTTGRMASLIWFTR